MNASRHRVLAQMIGEGFERDSELRLPDRPRFVEELVVAPFEQSGIIVAGKGATELLDGRSARRVMQRLLQLLDGRRTLSEVAEAAPELPARVVHDAVALLFSRGLLEDGVVDEAPEESDLLSFLGRFNDATRCNPNRWSALARVRAMRVRLDASIVVESTLRRLLEGSGFTIAAGLEPADIEIRVTSDDKATGTFAPRAPLGLPVRFGRQGFDIGPLLTRSVTACASCLEASHPHPEGTPDAPLLEIGIGITAHLVVTLLARTFSYPLLGGFYRYAPDPFGALACQLVRVSRTPGCAGCAIGGERWEPSDPRLAAWDYHTATALGPMEWLSRRDHQNHYRVSNLELAQTRTTHLARSARTSLPPARIPSTAFAWTPSTSTKASLDVASLSTVLYAMAGELAGSDGVVRRVSPTGGNLGSVRLWVAARHVNGLAPGLYGYESTEHGLRRFEECPSDLWASALGSGDRLPACIVVGAGDLAKVCQKYGEFGFRVVCFDAGISLAFGAQTARALDVAFRELCDFDPLVLEEFGIAIRREHPFPTFAIGLGPWDTVAGAVGPRARRTTRSDSERSLANRLDPLVRAILRGRPAPCLSPASVTSDVTEELHPNLEAAVRRRRATREFGPVTPDGEIVRAVFRAAASAVASRVLQGGPTPHLRPLLMVSNSGPVLPAGVYCASEDDTLVPRSDFHPTLARLCTAQGNLASAPAAIFLVANLRSALEHRDARGYAEQLSLAGTAVGAAWLTAAAYGLVGSAAGGILPHGLHETVGLDGFNECPVVSFHFGRRARDET